MSKPAFTKKLSTIRGINPGFFSANHSLFTLGIKYYLFPLPTGIK